MCWASLISRPIFRSTPLVWTTGVRWVVVVTRVRLLVDSLAALTMRMVWVRVASLVKVIAVVGAAKLTIVRVWVTVVIVLLAMAMFSVVLFTVAFVLRLI